MRDLRFLQGQAAERRRLGAILLAPEADGRERAAIELALNTNVSVEDARRALAAAPSQTNGRSRDDALASRGR